MSCDNCGREDGHFLGCPAGLAQDPPAPDSTESLCAKDGCTAPRAVSKGPRPAKYCDEHKTGSKKS